MQKAWSGPLKYALAILAIGFIGWQLEWRDLAATASKIPFWGLLGALLCLQLTPLIGAMRLRGLLRGEGQSIPLPVLWRLHYLGMFYNTLLPGGLGGDAVKLYLLNKHQALLWGMGLRLCVADRLNGVWVTLLMILALAPLSGFLNQFPMPWLVLPLLALAITGAYALVLRALLRQRRIALSMQAGGWSMAMMSAYLCMAVLLYGPLSPSEQWINYAVLFLVASVASLLPISVGGLGIRELVYYAGAPLVGGDAEVGVAFSLIFFGLYVASSLIGLFWKPKKLPEKLFPEE